MVCGDDWVRATLEHDATSAKTRRGDYELTMFATVSREAGPTVLGMTYKAIARRLVIELASVNIPATHLPSTAG